MGNFSIVTAPQKVMQDRNALGSWVWNRRTALMTRPYKWLLFCPKKKEATKSTVALWVQGRMIGSLGVCGGGGESSLCVCVCLQFKTGWNWRAYLPESPWQQSIAVPALCSAHRLCFTRPAPTYTEATVSKIGPCFFNLRWLLKPPWRPKMLIIKAARIGHWFQFCQRCACAKEVQKLTCHPVQVWPNRLLRSKEPDNYKTWFNWKDIFLRLVPLCCAFRKADFKVEYFYGVSPSCVLSQFSFRWGQWLVLKSAAYKLL